MAEVHVTASGHRFIPSRISLPKGEPVKLVIYSAAGNHTFTLKESPESPGAILTLEVPAGVTQRYTFTPRKATSYYFFCKEHEAEGMSGTIDVRA